MANHQSINGNTHTISMANLNSYSSHSIIIDTVYNNNIKIVHGALNDVVEIKNNNIKLNDIDTLDLKELIGVFKYIKEDYPNLYADLILKGIIK